MEQQNLPGEIRADWVSLKAAVSRMECDSQRSWSGKAWEKFPASGRLRAVSWGDAPSSKRVICCYKHTELHTAATAAQVSTAQSQCHNLIIPLRRIFKWFIHLLLLALTIPPPMSKTHASSTFLWSLFEQALTNSVMNNNRVIFFILFKDFIFILYFFQLFMRIEHI